MSDRSLGRAENWAQGRDVAIVAWGPMTAAAIIAGRKPGTIWASTPTVVNARFAQPLDVDTIVRRRTSALYVVLVDDADQTGGFAGWVLEHLLRSGVTQPLSIVAPRGTRVRSAVKTTCYGQCAARSWNVAGGWPSRFCREYPIESLLPAVTDCASEVEPERG